MKTKLLLKTLTFGTFLFSFSLWALNNPIEIQNYGGDSKEVELNFEDSFALALDEISATPNKDYLFRDLSEKDKKVVRQAAKLQILHLHGVFSYHETPINFSYYSGAILESQDPTIVKVSVSENTWKVSYTYQDKAVFFSPLFRNLSPKNQLQFYLPNQPKEIYRQSIPNPDKLDPISGHPLNPCTDEHDLSEAGYWYYWSPSREGCLAQIKEHIHKVTARITLLPMTKKTFPEYSQLFAPKDGTLNIRIIYGQDADFGSDRDIGRQTFESEFNIFKSLSDAQSKSRFSIESNEPFYKKLQSNQNNTKILLEMFYVNTEIESFDSLARESLKQSDVMIFAGHSYEGYYFDLDRLFEKPSSALPKDRYQIFYFDACTTYSYYGRNYFEAKASNQDPRGTKNLDLVVNGIGAPFLVDDPNAPPTPSNTTTLIHSLLGWDAQGRDLPQLLSWQRILRNISKNAGTDYTALTFVKGDEDNPTQLESSFNKRKIVK